MKTEAQIARDAWNMATWNAMQAEKENRSDALALRFRAFQAFVAYVEVTNVAQS